MDNIRLGPGVDVAAWLPNVTIQNYCYCCCDHVCIVIALEVSLEVRTYIGTYI